MNPETFDNDNAATTDGEYFAFVAWLSHRAVNEFRNARGDAAQEKMAMCRYYKRGLQANLTMSELVDFLAISADSILEVAGYSDEQIVALMREVSDVLTEDEIMATLLTPQIQSNILEDIKARPAITGNDCTGTYRA